MSTNSTYEIITIHLVRVSLQGGTKISLGYRITQ